jgi:Ca2+-binding RTX toxin-like protein
LNSEIGAAFINAVLADASYVNGLSGQGGVLAEKLTPVLTAPLAKYVGDHFSVVSQYTENNLTQSGFSVTVFQDLTSAQRYIAFRGSEGFLTTDAATDIDAVFLSGLARNQITSMVNWYLRAITAPNTPVVQLGSVFQTTMATGDGTLLTGAPMMVTGHSLGGELATVFSRLFSDNVAHASTFNGLGVGRLLPEVTFALIQSALGLGTTAYPAASSLTNYYAEHGINVATNSVWLAQVGGRVPLFNEEGTGKPNHGVYKLTDALALYDVMGRVDSSLSLQNATAILNASSATPADSLEKSLDAFRLLKTPAETTPTQVGDAEGAPLSRVDYHAKLAALRTAVDGDSAFRGQIVSLVGKSSTELKTLGDSDIAYRYAIKNLNPFVAAGIDYTQHNAAGQLGMYNSSTGAGSLTDTYLTDRANMLGWSIKKNLVDGNITLRSDRNETYVFENKNSLGETDVSVQVTGKQPFAGNPVHVIFGGDAGETLTGGVLYAGDHLYGGGGNDTLLGLGGNDYLEGNAGIDTLEGGDDADTLIGGADADRLDGGAGNDRLEGGLGFDTYVHGANGGLDRIRDVDGAGKVEFAISGGILTVTGGHRTAANEWRSDDQSFVFDLQTRASGQQDLWITGNNERVLVENFTNDNLGIHLDNAPVQPVLVGRVITFGPDQFDFHDEGTPDSKHVIANSGNNWITAGSRNVPITVEGRGGPDEMWGAGGDDVLFAGSATDLSNFISGSAPTAATLDGAMIFANGGNDLVVGGTGADWIAGGKGEDIIYGGPGNDVLSGAGSGYLRVTSSFDSPLPGQQKFSVFMPFIGFEVDNLFPLGAIHEALGGDHIIHSSIGLSTFNNRDSADTIYGGAGDDQIWGVFGDDELYGEAGNDQIRGGEGADTIYGGEGNDEIRGDDDHLLALELFGNDFIDGGAGEDVIYGELGDDDIYGCLGNDQLHGEEDNDFLSGEEGDDSLYGGDGWDILIGGAGSDVLNGGAGFDTYVFNTGDGQDQIVDSDSDSLYVFRSVFSPESLRVTVVGSDVKIQYGGSGDSVTIANAYVTSASGVAAGPTFELADGSTVDVPLLLNVGTTDPIVKHADGPGQTVVGGSGDDTLTGAAAAVLRGGRGNDVLTAAGGNNILDGGDGNDVLVGGPGANVLSGGVGDDVYRIGPSDGVTLGLDVIDDVEGENTVQFNSRIQLSDLTASAVVGEDGNPYLELSNSADYTVRIREGLSGAISHFAFSDGTSLGLESLLAQIGPLQIYGDEQDNILTGTGIADAINAGAGADVINAGDGNDMLNGGIGDDTLNGQAGDDRYVMSWGMGHDVAIDAGGGIITLGTGLVSSDLYSQASGADLFVGIKFTDERLLIKDYQSAAWRIDTGTGQTVAATELSDITSVTTHEGFFDHALAQRRAELFSGLTRDGFRVMADGTLERGTDERAVVVFSTQSSDESQIERQSPDTQVEFVNGRFQTTYTLAAITGGNSENTIHPFSNLAVVRGGAGDDIIVAQPSRSWGGLFSDGTEFGISADGGTGDDVLYGASGADVLFGGEGHDLLEGYGGADTYLVLPGEAGYDTIIDEGAAPRFYGGALSAEAGVFTDAYYTSLGLADWRTRPVETLPPLPKAYDFAAWEPFYNRPENDGASSVFIKPDTVEFLTAVALSDLQLSWGRVDRDSPYVTLDLSWGTGRGVRVVIPHAEDTIGAGVEYFKFADGTRLTMSQMIALAPPAPDFANIPPSSGTEGNDRVLGTDADDVLALGAGNDQAQGWGGQDYIMGQAGDDWMRGGGRPIQKYPGLGLQPDVDAPWQYARTFDSGNSGNDALLGGDGNDVLYGEDGSNLLAGGNGDDTLHGEDLTMFAGGAGTDQLEADSFFAESLIAFNRGDGQDTYSGPAGELVLSLGGGIQAADLTLTRSGADLIVGFGQADSIRVEDWNDTLPTATLQFFTNGVTTYDLNGLVSQFDAALEANPTLTEWSAGTSVSAYLTEQSMQWARGGALAYQYAITGSFDAMSPGQTLSIIDHENFVLFDQDISGAPGLPTIEGTPGDDVLIGTRAAETIIGHAGNDTLQGGAGNDVYEFNPGDGFDTIVDDGGSNVLKLGAGITPDMLHYEIGADGESLIVGIGSGDDAVHIDFDVQFADSNAVQAFQFADGTSLDLDALLAPGFAFDGTEAADVIEGTGARDVIHALGGDDTVDAGYGNDEVFGGDGADVLDGGDGDDHVDGGAGNDSLSGSYDNDQLDGAAGDDVISGGYGDDVLNGGADNDQLDGGFGNDTYRFGRDGGQDVVSQFDYGFGRVDTIAFDTAIAPADVAVTAEGLDVVFSIRGTDDSIRVANYSAGDEFFNPFKIDEVRFANGTVWDGATIAVKLAGGGGDPPPVGTEGNDSIAGTIGDDMLSGLGGDDLIAGNDGNDTLLGGAGNDSLLGDAGNDALQGGDGNDVLDGGAGADSMAGGAGDDVYAVNDNADIVIEAASEGVDTVQTAVSYSLGDNIENLTLTGVAAINATGNSLDNVLTGNSGANTLDGGAGADTMAGGLGDDSYVVDNAGDVITEAAGEGTDTVLTVLNGYALGANLENVTLQGTAALTVTGNNQNNVLTGNAGNNELIAGGGNDTLDGGAGADGMYGENGDDLYLVDHAGDTVNEGLNTGIDTVRSTVSYTLTNQFVENLTLVGATAINATGNTMANNLTGNAANNVLNGGAGNDTLDAGEGNDILDGGAGDDVLIAGAGDDLLIWNGGVDSFDGGTGIDTADFSALGTSLWISLLPTGGAFTTGGPLLTSPGWEQIASVASIENVVGTQFQDFLGGDAGANVLQAGAGNDSLDAGSGNDTLFGGLGNDFLNAGAGNDILDGGAGLDTAHYSGARSAYTITQAGATYTVTGPEGSDTLTNIERIEFTDAVFKPGVPRADMNADGRSDLLWRNSDGQVMTWQMNGAQHTTNQGMFLGPGPDWRIADGHGDYNGDGKSDILWRNTDGTRVIWQMDGAAVPALYALPAIGANWNIVDGHADFNGDGRSDILLRSTDGTVRVWQMNGGTVAVDNTLVSVPLDWAIVSAQADYNGDGTSDILWRNVDGRVDVWMMGGSQITGGASLAAPPASWSIVDAQGDYNGDDRSDILWRTADGSVRVWQMNGAAVLETGVSDAIPLDWAIVGHGDYNGDGTSDLLWRNVDGRVDMWTISGAQNAGGASFGGIPLSWSIVDAQGDYNGDGKSDVLWRNTDGTLQLWQMNGGQIISNESLGPAIPQTWTITSERGASLNGTTAADTLVGTPGNDTIAGNEGSDTLTGGAGMDSFVFDAVLNSATNVDTITDFMSATDKLLLSEVFFTGRDFGLVAPGNFVAEAGAAAHDADDFILYNTSTGSVSYDADGSGAQAAVQFAMLANHPLLAASDLHVGLL